MSYPETMNVESETQPQIDFPIVDIRTNDLTAVDRCDTCNAQAYVEATMKSGSVTLFCAHHYRKGEARLAALGARIKDETYKLIELPPRTQGED